MYRKMNCMRDRFIHFVVCLFVVVFFASKPSTLIFIDAIKL